MRGALAADARHWVWNALPAVLPATWRLLEEGEDGGKYYCDLLELGVIVSGAVEQDGRRWIHLSCSHARRIPRWNELREVKELFLGDFYAYQVLPPKERYVNIHPHVLHLWRCLDGDPPLPDFTRGGDTI